MSNLYLDAQLHADNDVSVLAKNDTVSQIWLLTSDGYLSHVGSSKVLIVVREMSIYVRYFCQLETRNASDNQNVWSLNEHGNLVYNKATGSELNGFVLAAGFSSYCELVQPNTVQGDQWDLVPV